MKKNSVKVCIRTRPTQSFAQNNLLIDEEHNTIQVKLSHEEDETPGVLNNKQNSFKFKYDHVFHNSSQTAVYDLYARDIVQGTVDGINGAVMSYGQTGAGKTFTMLGDAQSYEHRGVAPRAISQLFSEINSRIELEFRVSCTYMEVYNEKIFDLLSDLSSPDLATDYTIAEEKDGRGTFVRGLAEVEVKDEHSALNLLFSGGLSRTIATHKLNKQSNRSHSIFTIYLQQRQRSGVSERVVHSKLHLVDLAGSERLKKTMDSADGAMGDEVTRKESMSINRSLTYLEQCVVALARKGQSHIPYRQSKLTNVLKDCLGANCNTMMIACMWGEASHLEETVSTLRLASRMMRVQNETVSVETVDPSALIKKQEKIIRALKQELLMHDALVERTGVAYDPYTPEQQEAISQMLEKFLDTPEINEESVLNITNYRQMLEICKQFKKKLLQARADVKTAQEQSYLNDGEIIRSPSGRIVGSAGDGLGMGMEGTGAGGLDYNADSKIAQNYDPSAPMVGTTMTGGAATATGRSGFALGQSGADARPPGGIEGASIYGPSTTSPRGAASKFSPPGSPGQAGAKVSFASPDSAVGPGSTRGMSIDFFDAVGDKGMAMFESFVNTDGAHLYAEFVQAKSQVKNFRTKSKELVQVVNQAKAIIDRLQMEIEARKSSRVEYSRATAKAAAKDEMVDEEEFRLTKELKEAKRTYRNCFEQMQKYKNQAADEQSRVNSLKQELGSGFSEWSAAYGGRSPQHQTQQQGSPDYKSSVGGLDTSQQSAGFGGTGGLDQLDDQEAFDKLEMERVLANDPESLAFFNAQKTRRANITQNSGTIKQMQKNKRFA